MQGLVLLAQLVFPGLDVAQLGDRFLAPLVLQAKRLDLQLGDPGLALGARGLQFAHLAAQVGLLALEREQPRLLRQPAGQKGFLVGEFLADQAQLHRQRRFLRVDAFQLVADLGALLH